MFSAIARLLTRFVPFLTSWWGVLLTVLVHIITYLLVNVAVQLFTFFAVKKYNIASYLLDKITTDLNIQETVINMTGLASFVLDCFRVPELFTLLVSFTVVIFLKKTILASRGIG
jgi:hypothetical protein